MEIFLFALFALMLILSVAAGIPILCPLAAAFIMFFCYGLRKGKSFKEMCALSWEGVSTVGGILIAFALIGVLTALWRSSGTIAYIIYHTSGLCHPALMVLMTFLLCCLISFLTGTGFGTAATMGVICTTMATGMGIPIAFSGGAVMAGSYFGDRCSPMSTSALLVATLTKTDLYSNIKGMIRTSIVPFVLTLVFYILLGLEAHGAGSADGVCAVFARHFNLSPITLIPALIMVAFSLFRVKVRYTMAVSAAAAAIISVFVQDVPLGDILHIGILGFESGIGELDALLSGGGLVSMANVILIVCISSGYSGIFRGTGLLEGLERALDRVKDRLSVYGCVVLTAAVSAMISCNQTLTIMLVHQICDHMEKDKNEFAIQIENTAVVVPPLFPWTIACTVTITAVGAPEASILFAPYLFALPLYNWLISALRERKARLASPSLS